MSWMKIACETYDQNTAMIANFAKPPYLCPAAHMEASAQIEVSVDLKGNFTNARSITDRSEAETIIPVTEESASRSSGTAPHPLCDNLTYVAGDFADYAGSKKEADTARERFGKYMEGLAAWRNSAFSSPIVEAVYLYLAKGKLMEDLVKSDLVHLTGDGKLSGEKIAGKTYDKCMVRFRVDMLEDEGACWQNRDLMEDYWKFYLEKKSESARTDVCYLTGEQAVISDNHPKGILASSYGAKLISANDSTDFTYRGRFSTGEEAYAVSYEASQKAHNALKWLAKLQGFSVGLKDRRTYLCWNPRGKKVPQPGSDIFGTDDDEQASNVPTTMPGYKKKLERCINGYRNQFEPSDDIALMALEAATTGRLSIVYYNEMKENDFFDRLQRWYESCCWQYTTFDGLGNPRQEIKSPTIGQVIRYAFGVERDDDRNKDRRQLYVNDKLMIMQYQRLFHCIVDGGKLPRDFVEAIVQQVTKPPESFSYGNRERILSTACALVAKYYYENEGVEIKMELDRENKDRSYCYGRLLAVYDWAEYSTYRPDETRSTNAARLQSNYIQRPEITLLVLEQKIQPYYAKNVEKSQFYIDEISDILKTMEYGEKHEALKPSFVNGYYLERAYLKNHANKDKKKQEETK